MSKHILLFLKLFFRVSLLVCFHRVSFVVTQFLLNNRKLSNKLFYKNKYQLDGALSVKKSNEVGLNLEVRKITAVLKRTSQDWKNRCS